MRKNEYKGQIADSTLCEVDAANNFSNDVASKKSVRVVRRGRRARVYAFRTGMRLGVPTHPWGLRLRAPLGRPGLESAESIHPAEQP